MTRTVSILGSTGSIGKQSLEVLEGLPQGQFEVFALAAGRNIELLQQQIDKFHPAVVCVETEEDADRLASELKDVEVLCGSEGLKKIAGNTVNDVVLVAVTGLNGLEPTMEALKNGITVALANKETLVAAGNIVNRLAKKNHAKIIPVDSEHSAIFQCIAARDGIGVRKIILTASGGPFRTKTIEEIRSATVETALAHPRWSMGDKITVDSATLMNKGLEVIEAHMLFNAAYENIEVVIHPQSVVHGAVEFDDGSVIAQMGVPSMHIPIQFALTYPETCQGIKTGSLDLTKISRLDFEKPDFEKFPCLKLAYKAGKKGGTAPVVLNAVNEEAVYAFLRGEIRLTDIPEIVLKALDRHENIENPTLEDILRVDKASRELYQEALK
jgi:1-deoxy-D-xylulose-5-phosphate reductoisomerase